MHIKNEEELQEINRIRQEKILNTLMRDDVTIERDELAEEDMVLNMGPQHPATHGVLRVVLKLDGENIAKCVPELGYLHRGYEKLAENTTFFEYTPHTDRLDYMSPMSNNVAYTLAVENALGIEAPERAQWIRTLVSEMARVSSHLMALGSFCLDLGAMTAFIWTFTEREKLYDLFEEICGARFTTNYSRIGGVASDISDETFEHIREFLNQFPGVLDKVGKLINRNRIYLDRVSGVGIMPADKAIELGLTGPTLRGSGVARDLRKDKPYLKYAELDFEVKTRPECDCWARNQVRVDEMYESTKMLHQILDKMPAGEIIAKSPKAALPRKKDIYTKMEELIHDFKIVNTGGNPEPGDTYTPIESPKGELGFYITSDGTGHPWKMKIRSPSTSNLQGLQYMAEGSMIADIVAIIGSIDPIMGEADK
jgi:NADH-quinone oxidoreductase subunit D